MNIATDRKSAYTQNVFIDGCFETMGRRILEAKTACDAGIAVNKWFGILGEDCRMISKYVCEDCQHDCHHQSITAVNLTGPNSSPAIVNQASKL
jgi:hypothetical protein